MTRWLLFVYRLPPRPSAPRVAVWRALRRLPGGYVRNGVYAAPFSRLHHGEFENLAHDVRNYGGTATIIESTRVQGDDLFATAPKSALGRGMTSGRTPRTKRAKAHRRVDARARSGRSSKRRRKRRV